MNETSQRDTRKRPPLWARILLYILLGGSILALLVSPAFLFVIPFMYDAPGSETDPVVSYAVKGILALPVVAILTGVIAGVTIRRYTRLGLIVACGIALAWFLYMTVVSLNH